MVDSRRPREDRLAGKSKKTSNAPTAQERAEWSAAVPMGASHSGPGPSSATAPALSRGPMPQQGQHRRAGGTRALSSESAALSSSNERRRPSPGRAFPPTSVVTVPRKAPGNESGSALGQRNEIETSRSNLPDTAIGSQVNEPPPKEPKSPKSPREKIVGKLGSWRKAITSPHSRDSAVAAFKALNAERTQAGGEGSRVSTTRSPQTPEPDPVARGRISSDAESDTVSIRGEDTVLQPRQDASPRQRSQNTPYPKLSKGTPAQSSHVASAASSMHAAGPLVQSVKKHSSVLTEAEWLARPGGSSAVVADVADTSKIRAASSEGSFRSALSRPNSLAATSETVSSLEVRSSQTCAGPGFGGLSDQELRDFAIMRAGYSSALMLEHALDGLKKWTSYDEAHGEHLAKAREVAEDIKRKMELEPLRLRLASAEADPIRSAQQGVERSMGTSEAVQGLIDSYRGT